MKLLAHIEWHLQGAQAGRLGRKAKSRPNVSPAIAKMYKLKEIVDLWQWYAGKPAPFGKARKQASTVCSTYQFPWCKYSHQGSIYQSIKLPVDSQPAHKIADYFTISCSCQCWHITGSTASNIRQVR